MIDSDVSNKLIAIAFSLLILPGVYVFRVNSRSWVSPAVIFSLFWFLLTFFPLILQFKAPVDPLSVLFITCCTFLFGAPQFFFNWSKALNKKLASSTDLYSNSFLYSSFFILQFLVVVGLLINLSIQDISVLDILTDFKSMSLKYLKLRYDGGIVSNIYSRLGVVFNYVGVCIGGLIISSLKTKWQKLIVFIIAFVPSILFMLIYGDKGTLFLCAAFFYSGIVVSRLQKGDVNLTNKKTNIITLGLVVLILPLIATAFLVRDEDALSRISYYLSSYALTHVYSFSDWFDSYLYNYSIFSYVTPQENTYGFSTFMAVFKAFGDKTYVPAGYYGEYYHFSDQLRSNIYTIFRGLIQDFGVIGTFLYMAVTGCLFSWIYHLILSRPKSSLAIAAYICMWGYIYTSFIISIMVWNSIFILFVILAIILFINNYYISHKSQTVKS